MPDCEDLTERDLMILSAIAPNSGMTYREIVISCGRGYHPTPHDLMQLRERGYLEREDGTPDWLLTDAAIERLEVAGDC